jgi:hypothetical protein
MTVSLAITSAGTTVFIGAAPATYDAPGMAAVSFTQIAEVVSLGSFGKKYNVVKHLPIDSRQTIKRKGSFDSGSLAVKVAHTSDSGQALLQAASNSDLTNAFKIVLPTGKIEYFTGVVTEYLLDVSSVDTILGASFIIELDGNVIEV